MRTKEMKPQDILVLAKIVAMGKNPWKGQDLAAGLCISKSEVSESLNRSKYARLLDFSKRKVNTAAFLEFLEHGIRYVYPAIAKGRQKGFLTAFSAPPLNKKIASQAVVVWSSENGTAIGESIEPLYPAVVQAIQKDKTLYELMSLIEAIRIGRVREIVLAKNELKARFQSYANDSVKPTENVDCVLEKTSKLNLRNQEKKLPYFLATKFEAVLSRGLPDLRMSHDFEDIIYLWSNVPNVLEQCQKAEGDLRNYLSKTLKKLMSDWTFNESVEAHLPFDNILSAERIRREMGLLC